MPSHYVYLISSLPMLHFGLKPPFSREKFILLCADLIPEKDLEVLKAIAQGHLYQEAQPTLRRWLRFETMLRNELVKIRAARKHLDPLKYLREDGYADLYISHAVMNAYRNPSVLEAERALDLERWRFLDELSFGHYFDLDSLIIYLYKLLILERWQKIEAQDKVVLLEETLQPA